MFTRGRLPHCSNRAECATDSLFTPRRLLPFWQSNLADKRGADQQIIINTLFMHKLITNSWTRSINRPGPPRQCLYLVNSVGWPNYGRKMTVFTPRRYRVCGGQA